MTDPREVRLRPEHAEHYPEIPPGRWLLAGEVAEVVALGSVGALLHTRALDGGHFEFRGGTAGRRPGDARTRAGDG